MLAPGESRRLRRNRRQIAELHLASFILVAAARSLGALRGSQARRAVMSAACLPAGASVSGEFLHHWC